MGVRALAGTRHGFSLVELLCVIAIIGILASMMLPAFAKALRRARGLGDHLGGPGGVEMRIGEVATNYTRYHILNPKHGKLSRNAFIDELRLSPQAEAWLKLGSVEYKSFAGSDPLEQPAIIVQASSGGGSGDRQVIFRIGHLILPYKP